MNKHQLTNKIRYFRFNNDEMTQEQLAKKVQVTRQTIIAIESGKYTPSLILAMKIAVVFNIKIEDLFCLGEPITQNNLSE